MDLIADGLLIATALTAALYCLVLSQRLRRLTDARAGVGAQIAELSRVLEETRAAVADTRKGLAESRASARNAGDALAREIATAREVTAALQGEAARARRRAAFEQSATPTAATKDHASAPPTPEELVDAIPDWPDGVVSPAPDPAPSEDAAQDAYGPDTRAADSRALAGPPEGPAPVAASRAAGAAPALLRVERMPL